MSREISRGKRVDRNLAVVQVLLRSRCISMLLKSNNSLPKDQALKVSCTHKTALDLDKYRQYRYLSLHSYYYNPGTKLFSDIINIISSFESSFYSLP